MLTFCGVTGKMVGRTKMTLTNRVHITAQRLIQKLALPRWNGPGSNLPNIILQRIGIQYDQSSAIAVRLKIAEMAV